MKWQKKHLENLKLDVEAGLSDDEIAQKIGISRASVAGARIRKLKISKMKTTIYSKQQPDIRVLVKPADKEALCKALAARGYYSVSEWMREQIREVIKK